MRGRAAGDAVNGSIEAGQSDRVATEGIACKPRKKTSRNTAGFSREPGWRDPCPARGVTSAFVRCKLLLGGQPTAQVPRTPSVL